MDGLIEKNLLDPFIYTFYYRFFSQQISDEKRRLVAFDVHVYIVKLSFKRKTVCLQYIFFISFVDAKAKW